MSDQVSILVGQNRNVVGRFCLLLYLRGNLFEIIIFLSLFTYYLVKCTVIEFFAFLLLIAQRLPCCLSSKEIGCHVKIDIER